MHIDAKLVRRLLAGQLPQWADLPVTPVLPGGWDNLTFRVGNELLARLPSAERYVAQREKEHRWLPVLAPHLPLPIPEPLALGQPAEGYPWPWGVFRWIEGETARHADARLAADLARFLTALQRVPPDGPPPGPHNFFRGGPLTTYDAETRQAARALRGRVDTRASLAVWEAALAAHWQGPPVWIHGDVAATNLLVCDGRLSAVIDWGGMGVGDPACDLTIAWTFFEGEARIAFQAGTNQDQPTWARAQGWAVWKALIALAEHIDKDQERSTHAWWVLAAILADCG